jgi:hypothetical protein
MDSSTIQRLQALAANQHGVFTTKQAAALGLEGDALRHVVSRGWIRRVRRGVYAFRGLPRSPWEAVTAAALAAGPSAAISHRTAAAIHGFHGIALGTPEISVPRDYRLDLDGVIVHRPRRLAATDIQVRSGISVTSPIRTLVDIAGSTNDYLLPRILDEGSISRLWTPEAVMVGLGAAGPSAGRAGVRRLRHLLSHRLGESRPDGYLEQRVIRLLNGVAPPFLIHLQIELDGRLIELDTACPSYLVAGEIDGREVRLASRTKFDSDRLRSNLLQRHGWREVHFTASMDDRTILAQIMPLFPRDVIRPGGWLPSM